jgi:hypothetical protein
MELAERIRKLTQQANEPIVVQSDDTHEVTRIGRLLEQRFFGYTLPDSSNLSFDPGQYIDFRGALKEMKETQPEGYDPANPQGGCNEQFFVAVKSFLPINNDDLRYYISVETRLDFWHGTDAVFSWLGVDVTMDLTADPNKKFRAEICIFADDIDSGEVYTSVAQEIALLLISKRLDLLDRYHREPKFIPVES